MTQSKNGRSNRIVLVGIEKGKDARINRHKTRKYISCIFFLYELVQHGRFVAHAEQREIHREGVKRIRYMSDNDCVMSCSLDPRRSLVVMDAVRGKNKSYVFSLSKVRTISISVVKV